jgi:hypothetical protein
MVTLRDTPLAALRVSSVSWETANFLTIFLPVQMASMTCLQLFCFHLPANQSLVHRYLHLGFRAPERLVRRERIRFVWAILRNRHSLLASRVEMKNYDDVRFVYVYLSFVWHILKGSQVTRPLNPHMMRCFLQTKICNSHRSPRMVSFCRACVM